MSTKLERSFTLSDKAKSVIRKLLHQLKAKWQEAWRKEERFLENNQQWLNEIMYFDGSKEDGSPPQATSKETHMGRPKQQFIQSSERTKRRRTKDIRSQSSTEELSYATQMTLRIQGNVEAAKIVKEVTSSSLSKARKYRKSLEFIPEVTFSADEAVSLVIEQKLSRSQYQGLWSMSKKKKCILYPSYHLVLKAKCKCYPEKDSISICETSAEVKLQALLDHTINRLLTTQMDVVKSLPDEQLLNLNLICKWVVMEVLAKVCTSKNLVMMMEVNQMLVSFSLRLFQCNLYRSIKIHLQKSLCGKIRDHHHDAFVDQ